MDLDYLLYNIKYDSVHGRFPYHVEKTNGGVLVNGKKIQVTDKKDPKEIPWGSMDASFVCESTGVFLSKDKAQSHIISGAKRVILSAPAKDDTPTYVYGVNHN